MFGTSDERSGGRGLARLNFKTRDGDVEAVAERARTPEELRLGLMFRRRLAPNQGMIFEFPDVRPRSMWMRNTFIPLDMVFVDEADRVIDIVHEAEPLSEEPRGVSEPAKYVIELPGGFCKRRGVRRGDALEVERYA